MNGYEPLLQETDGGLVCRDCMTFCYFGSKVLTPCDVDGCTCDACERLRRALELDDRPDAALANIARDLEAEARPDLQELLDERYGWPTLRTERHWSAA